MGSRQKGWGQGQGNDSGQGQGTYCVPGADRGSSRHQGLTGSSSQLGKLCRLPDPQTGHQGSRGEDVSSVVPQLVIPWLYMSPVPQYLHL